MQVKHCVGVSAKLAATAIALSIVFGDVSAQGNFKVNGSAVSMTQNCFRITNKKPSESGSVWYQNYISLAQDFDLQLSMNFGGDSTGADGLAFVLQPLSLNQGGNGNQLGYGGIYPSIEVEYDTYQNADLNDPSFDHIAIQKNGSPSHSPDTNRLAAPVQASEAKKNIKDGSNHLTRITWTAATTTLRVYFDNVLRQQYTSDLVTTVFNGNPNVYWGITGSTGAFSNVQSFCVEKISFHEIIYVNAAAAGNGSGISWADAYPRLQDAIDRANCCPGKHSQIWVAKGTYYPDEGKNQPNNDRAAAFRLSSDMAVYGGFAGTETQLSQRNWQTNSTILSGDLLKNDSTGFVNIGDNAYHVVVCSGVNSTAILDGFTIKGGHANGSFPANKGGAFFNENAQPTIANCFFTGNAALGNGGAVCNSESSPTLINCTFFRNRSAASGGAVSNEEGSVPVIINATFSQNVAGQLGGALYNGYQSNAIITNSILWNDKAGPSGAEIDTDSEKAILAHSLVQGGYGTAATLSSDPLFVSAASGNLQLQPCSPAIDAGSNTANETDRDLAGNPRIVNIIDMGAYEYQGKAGLLKTYYRDKDGDGFGVATDAILACGAPPVGYAADSTDCDDADKSVWRRGFFYIDADGDGYTVGSGETLCFGAGAPAGFTPEKSKQDDCDDNNDKIYPAAVVFVNALATGRNNGTSWANGFINLQDALLNAGKCGGNVQVWVASGTYYPDKGAGINAGDREASFVLQKGISVFGGFSGAIGDTLLNGRNWLANAVTLSGDIGQPDNATDNSFHVLTVANADTTLDLDGLVVTGGNANGQALNRSGGGLLLSSSGVRITNCRFTKNAASFFGGGIHSVNASPIVRDSYFDGNTARGGGGLFMQDTSGSATASFTGCTFTGNEASLYGGGLYTLLSSPTFERCTFSENSAYVGGGVYNYLALSEPRFTNCLFFGNAATNLGGGMYNNNASPTLVNVAFTKNTAVHNGGGMNNSVAAPTLINCSFSGNEAGKGGAIDNDGAVPALVNCIVWGNKSSFGPAEISSNNSPSPNTDSAMVRYSIVRGGYSGAGNFDKDPLFVDAGNGNLRLKACSPAVNKGIDSLNKTLLDLAGNPRLKGDSIDLGAYEFQGTPCANSPLPVRFVSLTAQPEGDNVKLVWMVQETQDVVAYTVEHSANGRNFVLIAHVAAAGQSSYVALHLHAGAGLHYYRVRSIDRDGKPLYSPVVKISLGKAGGYFVVAPNPVEGGSLNVQFNAQPAGQYRLQLVNSYGQVLCRMNLVHSGGYGVYTLPLGRALPAGIYQLQIEQPSGTRETFKVLRQ